MNYYKYLNTRYVDYLLAGRLRFGALNYYRLLEALTGDAFIGDIKEATRETRITSFEYDSSKPEDLANNRKKAQLSSLRMQASDGGKIVADEMIIKMVADAHVFSMALGDELTLRPEFSNAKTGYDACIEINAECLLDQIRTKGIVVELGKPATEVFQKIDLKSVQYGNFPGDFESTDMAASPSFKAEKYSSQAEARIILHHTESPYASELARRAFTIEVPNPEEFTKVVFKNASLNKAATPNSSLIEDLADAKSSLEWCSKNGNTANKWDNQQEPSEYLKIKDLYYRYSDKFGSPEIDRYFMIAYRRKQIKYPLLFSERWLAPLIAELESKIGDAKAELPT